MVRRGRSICSSRHSSSPWWPRHRMLAQWRPSYVSCTPTTILQTFIISRAPARCMGINGAGASPR
eukprot:12865545-Heterocapsa_arctica.AAC.1